MAATYHHARRLYIGTTAERAAVVLDVDGIGTDYWDTDVGVLYIWDGTAWVAGFAALPHSILSATHDDTTPAVVVRGDLMTGQGVAPLWVRLAHPGALYHFQTDANDVGWLQDIIMVDEGFVGAAAALSARITFDYTPAPNEITVGDATLIIDKHNILPAGAGQDLGSVVNPWDVFAAFVDVNGAADALILDADGDTTISAPTDDEIDIEVGGVDIAEWTASGLHEIAGRDVYPEGDGGGLFQRNVNHWRTPDDHFNTFAGWLWDAVTFNGAPSTVNVATYPSLLHLMNDNIAEDHFAYQVVATGSTREVRARLYIALSSYIGVRLDDGTNNNFYEIRFTSSASIGRLKLQHRYQTGGGGITLADLVDPLPPQFYDVRAVRTGTTGLSFLVVDAPIPFYAGGVIAGAWTATRLGLIFGQRGIASNADFSGLMDWIEMA